MHESNHDTAKHLQYGAIRQKQSNNQTNSLLCHSRCPPRHLVVPPNGSTKLINTPPALELYAFQIIPSLPRTLAGPHSSHGYFRARARHLSHYIPACSTPLLLRRLSPDDSTTFKSTKHNSSKGRNNDQSEKCFFFFFEFLGFQGNRRALTPEPSSTVAGTSGSVCHHPPGIQYPSSDPLLERIDPSSVGVARKTLLGQCAAKMWSR